jgi:hypothetical protein
VYEFRDAPVGGHRGMNQTFRAIKPRTRWLTWEGTRRSKWNNVKFTRWIRR